VGLGTMAWLLPQPRQIGSVVFDVHTLLYASLAVVVGFQSVLFWVIAQSYGMREGIVPFDERFERIISIATLERGLIASAALLAIGLCLGVYALGAWNAQGFGVLNIDR